MSKSARSFKMTVGISLQHFDLLMCDIEKAYPQAESERLTRPDRKRRVGAGHRLSLHHPGHGPSGPHVLPDLPDPGRDGPSFWDTDQGPISTNIDKMSQIILDYLPLSQKIHKQACKTTTI